MGIFQSAKWGRRWSNLRKQNRKLDRLRLSETEVGLLLTTIEDMKKTVHKTFHDIKSKDIVNRFIENRARLEKDGEHKKFDTFLEVLEEKAEKKLK